MVYFDKDGILFRLVPFSKRTPTALALFVSSDVAAFPVLSLKQNEQLAFAIFPALGFGDAASRAISAFGTVVQFTKADIAMIPQITPVQAHWNS